MLKRGDDMKNIIKVMMVFICVVSLVACGKKDETVSTNKDGTLYEAGVGVSFYYPNDFQLSETDKSDGVIRFVKENQVLFYKVEKNEYDNDTTQLSELYKGELESSGVSSLEVKTPALESGLKCYEYKGNYGYLRITLELRNRGFVVNQKKVQRLMKLLGSSSQIRRKRKYSSYQGEVGKKADNLSDQGWQYQHQYYHQFLEDKGIQPSMSRKGNSPDNGMMESFFGILKSEMFYGYEKMFHSLEQLEQAIVDYIDYYNNKRIKVKLKGLSPVQYRTAL